MKRQIEKTQTVISSLLVIFIFLACLPLPINSQEKPIIISFGQPNIWSLEQAHYLLGRRHRQNLDLQTAELGDIDPNEINARRINIVKSLLQAGFKYDEAIRINNQLRKNDKTVNSQRRPELLAQRSALQAESLQLSREIASLKLAKSKTKDADEKAALDEQIEAQTEQKAAVSEQLAQVNDELKNLSTIFGDFQSATAEANAFDDKKLPSSVLDDLIKENVKDFTKEPTSDESKEKSNK
jgi:hypothetical protein